MMNNAVCGNNWSGINDLRAVLTAFGLNDQLDTDPAGYPPNPIEAPEDCEEQFGNDQMEIERCLCLHFPAEAALQSIACSSFEPIYWYHPDYLGLTDFVTDRTGQPYQHFFYAPFGEALLSQHTGTGYYNTPYRFNAKELDSETGLIYYGARYYLPKESVWMSVDAKHSSFPGMNPYNFSLNNPALLVDPDGNAPDIIYLDKDNNEVHRIKQKGAHIYFRVEGNTNDLFWPGMGNWGDPSLSVYQIESPVKVNFRSGVDNTFISEKSMNILQDIGIASRVYNLDITSTARDARGQAIAMYDNLIRDYNEQRRTYRSPGQIVIDTYDQALKNGLDKNGIIEAMTNTINEIGPSNVSSHCANPELMNVLDISQRNISPSLRKGFMDSANKLNGVRMLNENRVFHIEIEQ